MSIFTRLNVLVAAAIMLIMGFIFVLEGLSDEKDALIIEYREVARHENIANRLQANLLQKRVNLLLYATSGKQQFINKIAKNDELITQFTKDARANSIASDAELTQIEADLVSYKTAQAIYLSNLAAIVLHASQAADSLKGIHAHNARDEQLHGLIAEQLQSFITNPRSFEFIQPLIAAFERDLANDYHFKADEPDLNEKIRQNLHQIELSVARARQASVTLRSIGTPLSNTIENLKLELKKRQDTLGPQLKEKIATTEQLTTTAVVIIAVIFIVIVIVARVKLLGQIGRAHV